MTESSSIRPENKNSDVIHVFYIHSTITLLSSLGVIEKYQLHNVVFFFGRNFQTTFITIIHKVVFLPEKLMQLEVVSTEGSTNSFWLYRRLRIVDNMLNSLNSQRINCYLPHTNNFLMQSIITHSKVEKYFIIEEGLLNYNPINVFVKQTDKRYSEHSAIKKIIRYFKHFNRSVKYNPIKSFLGGVFLFNINGKNNFDNRITGISMPNLELNKSLINIDNVFVFDNPIADDVMESVLYYELLKNIFTSMEIESLFIKFHPAQSDTSEIMNILSESSIKFEILPPDYPMELMFLINNKTRVYGLWSSLLLYASVAGLSATSYAGIAINISSKARLWSKSNVPNLFYEKINVLYT